MPSRQSKSGDLHQERRSSSPSSDFKFGLLTYCCFLLTSLLFFVDIIVVNACARLDDFRKRIVANENISSIDLR